MRRRAVLLSCLAPALTDAQSVQRGRRLSFPRDHGAHLDAQIEWWYATGWLGTFDAPRLGFQLTFFRRRTGLALHSDSRFAPRHLLFAHAAVTDLATQRHHHAQQVARWSGTPDALPAHAAVDGCELRIGHWRLHDDGTAYVASLPGERLSLDLRLARRQPLLLQGEAGFSRKGPQETQASHYVSEPQLDAQGAIEIDGARQEAGAGGQAWLDHEWSDQLLPPEAAGWDWIGFNLADGSALTAFRLRRSNGGTLWAGGSWRAPGQTAQRFSADAVAFRPGRIWTSPSSAARYPVELIVETPAGRFRVAALLDAQELDSRASTGTQYWEGLSELLDDSGRRVGLGYLEMTGYAGRLRL